MSKGLRIRLVSTSDPYTRLVTGDEGVVTDIDDIGTVHVKWDNGSSLGLIPREDSWEVLDDIWDIDNGCTHDWNFIDGDEGVMKCSHCGHYQY
jgi:hypothetical protein